MTDDQVKLLERAKDIAWHDAPTPGSMNEIYELIRRALEGETTEFQVRGV